MANKSWYMDYVSALIEDLETKSLARKESLEQFYRGLKSVIDELKDRLAVCRDELPRDIASEILR